ncbi:MAG: S-formylglutathione hydrolase [Sulfitobacter sp.]|jgi:S-formylglutathione hydrolase
MELVSSIKCFQGSQNQYQHQSTSLSCAMYFSVYLPPQAVTGPVPVLYWLSGLTCTDQNFVTKAGAQAEAAKLGIAIVCPDTSPRGENIADDPNGDWDFGLGAGFYLDATESPYSEHYRMQDYVVSELFELVGEHLPVDNSRASISGHSMGGHGALTIALKHPDQYRSVSAFAPIAAPIQCPWGVKAFSSYLGEDRSAWQAYDASVLIASATKPLPMLIDQGDADVFLVDQLKPEVLLKAAETSGYPIQYRQQIGYDHSFFFIASFIAEHLRFHAEHV